METCSERIMKKIVVQQVNLIETLDVEKNVDSKMPMRPKTKFGK